MASITYRTLTIEQDGSLSSSPSKMHALTGDGIVWIVDNTSNVTVKVKIKDFQKKSNGSPVSAVTFLASRATVPANDLPGLIMGQVTFAPGGGSGSTTLTKYTIEVRSSLFDHDYDPDLEIEKP